MLILDRMRYGAEITAGALRVPESRVVANLLLKGETGEALQEAIVKKNVLQSRSPLSAVRIGRLIRQRLELMPPDLWRLIVEGSGTVATHAALAAAIKHSTLLGDFLDLVVREQYRVFAKTLPKRLFDDYLRDCRGRDPKMPQFNESTQRKLQTTVYRVLEQSGYIDNTRSLKLQPVHIADPVIRCLEKHDERYVLRCMQVGP